MSVCNENEEQSNMEKLFGEESLIPQFRCDCLDPCVQLKYRFQVCRKMKITFENSHISGQEED